MSKKKKIKTIDENIYVLRSDYTYSNITNSDMSIINASNDVNVKYLVFPVNGYNGIKYILEKRENVAVISSIKIRVTGELGFAILSEDVADINDCCNKIDLSANNIYEYYNLLGSLYNLEICAEMLDMSVASCTEYRPILTNFEIDIVANGIEYHLDPDLYKTVVPDDEFSLLKDFNETILLVTDLIDYIEHTVSNKNAYDNVVDRWKSFMLYDDHTYSKLQYGTRSKCYQIKSPYLPSEKKIKESILENSIILIDSDSPIYTAVTYGEFDTLRSDDAYCMSYALYYDEVATSMNAIPEDQLSVDVLYELDNSDYYVQWSDTLMFQSINQAIFTMISLRDIGIILNEALPWYEEEFSNICYTWHISKDKDKLHKISIVESVTDKLINKDNIDMLTKLVRSIHRYEYTEAFK